MNNHKKIINSVEEEHAGWTEFKDEVLIEHNWHTAYKDSIKDISELSKFIFLDENEKAVLKQVTKIFPVRIPLYYLSLIKELSDKTDPLRKQCIPSSEELKGTGCERVDPLGEEKTSPISCLVHRYPDRALLIATNRCFMYCRHCTRKRLWAHKITEPTLKDIELALSYVKDNSQIRELIISGGDPLTLATERLDYILSSVSRIRSIETIRIGTRALVVLPQRIDKSLCKVLEKYENLWVNTQFNHPLEITPYAIEACKKLQSCGIPISNQSVLLKGINDNLDLMISLCQKLQNIRVRPYYLYECDPVIGASHFRTSIWKGIEIIERMRGYTSGMCIPNFVVDGPDGRGKIPIGPNYLLSISPEGVTLRNYNNETFFYYNPKD